MHLAGVKTKERIWPLPGDWPVEHVRVVWSKRRSVALRFHPMQGVELRVPLGVSEAEAKSFLVQKKQWLSGQIHQHQARAAHFPAPPPGTVYFRGSLLPVQHQAAHPPFADDTAVHLNLNGPPATVERRLRNLLRSDLVARIESVFAACQGNDLSLPRPPQVSIRRMKSRWGSCSASGSMRFNEALAHLDDRCVRYVVCHEWAHVRHFNHSPTFYAQLEQLLPGHRADERHVHAHAMALVHPVFVPSETP